MGLVPEEFTECPRIMETSLTNHHYLQKIGYYSMKVFDFVGHEFLLFFHLIDDKTFITKHSLPAICSMHLYTYF